MSNPHGVESPPCFCSYVEESPVCPEHNPHGDAIFRAVMDGFQDSIGVIPEPKLALAIVHQVIGIQPAGITALDRTLPQPGDVVDVMPAIKQFGAYCGKQVEVCETYLDALALATKWTREGLEGTDVRSRVITEWVSA